MRRKQNLASAFGIQKENWPGNHAFFKDKLQFIRNNTQTAVTNMTIKRMLETYVSTYIFRSDR